MKTFRKSFIHSIASIIFLSLTAISCEDLVKQLTLKVPTEITETIQLSRTEPGYFEILKQVDIASDEFNERREQMKDFKIESIQFVVVDNLTGGSIIPTDLQLDFYAGETRVSTGSGFLSGNTLQEQLNSLSPDYVTQLKQVVEIYVLDDPNPYLDITLRGTAGAAMDYTITFTMTAVIEANN